MDNEPNKEMEEFLKFWEMLSVDQDELLRVLDQVQAFDGGAGSGPVSFTQHSGGGVGTCIFSIRTTRVHDLLWYNLNLSPSLTTITNLRDSTLANIADLYHKRIGSPFGLDDWIQFFLCIRPYRTIPGYNSVIKHNEAIEEEVFETRSSLQLKPPYAAKKNLLTYFHAHRMYLSADSQDFDKAGIIADHLFNEWEAGEKDVTCVSYHCFVHYLCTGQWEKAIECIQRTWATLRLMENSARFDSGGWDDWTAMLTLAWYFATHISDFGLKLIAAMYVEAREFFTKRKIVLLKSMTPEGVEALTSTTYYGHIRQLWPVLPAPTTPAEPWQPKYPLTTTCR